MFFNGQPTPKLKPIPVKFSAEGSRSFKLKFARLNPENSYKKLEFDLGNELILIFTDSDTFAVPFPPEFSSLKSSLDASLLNWETTKDSILITYRSPPSLIVIDDEVSPPNNHHSSKKPIEITIEDSPFESLKRMSADPSKRVLVIGDSHELGNSYGWVSYDRDSRKRFQRRLYSVMRTVEREFSTSVALRKYQVKKLASQLIDNDFDSYEKAMEKGFSFDVSSNRLFNPNELPDIERNVDVNTFVELKDANTMDLALQELDEAVRNKPKKREKTAEDRLRRKRNERKFEELMDESTKEIEGENNDMDDYEIKKKNKVYLLNEDKFKRLVSNSLPKPNLKRKYKSLFLDEEEAYL